MPLFARNRKLAVQSFLLKVLNNHCSELRAAMDGPRLERRVNLTLVLAVVPVEEGELAVGRAFTAVAKEFSSTGVALVLDQSRTLNEVVLGFRFEDETTWVRAQARHHTPLGGDFRQVGVQLIEVVSAASHPELRAVAF